ncbi:hypothetical protein PoB_006161000 [Plakobranchus ocellatus]|uniref:Uncharacterized protein n=1 Tax=Plakobranchus ocellatus TaxID=259542 RepID=A0AAV4CTH7_9GAST|nr:hypothetical protein PoB_006161000 [Plakobranchus ocellatus]
MKRRVNLGDSKNSKTTNDKPYHSLRDLTFTQQSSGLRSEDTPFPLKRRKPEIVFYEWKFGVLATRSVEFSRSLWSDWSGLVLSTLARLKVSSTSD